MIVKKSRTLSRPWLSWRARAGGCLGLLIMQCMGKAMKKLGKDTIRPSAASPEGDGKSFATQEGLEQIGTFCGAAFRRHECEIPPAQLPRRPSFIWRERRWNLRRRGKNNLMKQIK